jgi:TRAP-type C4-dicarboxylate transport system substrate-binding protein
VAEVNAYVTSFGIVMNPDSYEGLPDDLKAVFDASLVGVEEAVGEKWDSLNGPGKEALVAGGATINVPSEAELAEFQAIGDEVAEAILAERESASPDARAVYAKMRELAEAHRQ